MKPYIERLLLLIRNPAEFFYGWFVWGRLNWIPDKIALSILFYHHFGYWMDWKNPKTFNEKLQWLKIHDRNPLYTKLVDKYEVRKYIAETIGEEYLIPLLGVWDNVNDIDFEKLPNQFVLKCTHDSGSVIICKNKQDFNIRETKIKLSKALRIKYYTLSREWPYKKVKPRIIAEQYLESTDLKDYKFQVYNGIVKNGFVCSKRFSSEGLHVTFFDRDWKLLKFTKLYPRERELSPKPLFFEKMVKSSEILAGNARFVRVDFYEHHDKLYIGEITFYPGAGFERFTPIEWDKKFGDLINLYK